MRSSSLRIAEICAAGVALCVSVGCDAAGAPSTPSAITSSVVVSPPTVINASAAIPGNGGLLIAGPFSGPLAVAVASNEAPSAPPVAGSVQSLFHYEVWTGDAPLPIGSYSVAIENGPFGVGTSTIQFVEPRTTARPALESQATLFIERDVPVVDCCWALVDRVPRTISCFTVETIDRATLSVSLSTREPATALTQLLFRVGAAGADAGNPLPFMEQPRSVLFPAQADSYCYEVEAFEITTGESYIFGGPELCVPHGTAAALETRTVDLVVETQLHRGVCPAPPASHQDAWCALNRTACEAEEAGTVACSLAGHVCRGEPRPAGTVYDPSGGTVDYPGAGGASGMTAGGASGTVDSPSGSEGEDGEDDREPPETVKRAANCSCGFVRPRASDFAAQLAALGALAVLAARRARRRIRASDVPVP